MYRYSVDNAITYTSEDFVLFKESPFASWMERLTLENPDHGIPADMGSEAPRDTIDTQDDLADTLRAEGKNVVLIEPQLEESIRRAATLDAMRKGVDFVVNGQLALGTLSGSANLLMRTSGYSELGNYLYVPCSTQKKTSVHSALRLCFLADLLHSLQGQLPPQMLIIRGGSDVVPLETEDHIYHYRAVKHRFMSEQQAFRKHKMPDPAESAHFGRWSECANEVLKQRALRTEQEPDQQLGKAPDNAGSSMSSGQHFGVAARQSVAKLACYPQEDALPTSVVNSIADQEDAISVPPAYSIPSANLDVPIAYTPQRAAQKNDLAYDLDRVKPAPPASATPAFVHDPGVSSGTLVEQARKLVPKSQLQSSDIALVDDALENLAFIGSSNQVPTIGQSAVPPRNEHAHAEQRRASHRNTPAQEPQSVVSAPAPDVAASQPEPETSKLSVRYREPALEREQMFADANASMVAPPPSLRNLGPAVAPVARDMVTQALDPSNLAKGITASNFKLPEVSSSVRFADTAGDDNVSTAQRQPELESEHSQDTRNFAPDKASMVDMDATIPVAGARSGAESSDTALAESIDMTFVPAAEKILPQRPRSPATIRAREDAAAFAEIFSDKDTYLSDDSRVETFNSSLITSEEDYKA